ncbi:MAG TPA: YdeI/OmpD-associated family protein [Sphingobacteriaceae bacterium]
MQKRDPRVDKYILEAADFARPILIHLRELIHIACPEIRETIKWGIPHFDYKGTVCNMASFKQHCSFGFWKASLMTDNNGLLEKVGKTAMGHFGQLRHLGNLPSDEVFKEYIREAVRLNKENIKVAAKPRASAIKKDLEVPDYFIKALEAVPMAQEQFHNFSYSHKKEYVEWVTEAKTEATREKRLATTVEWLSEGKPRMWKYVK